MKPPRGLRDELIVAHLFNLRDPETRRLPTDYVKEVCMRTSRSLAVLGYDAATYSADVERVRRDVL